MSSRFKYAVCGAIAAISVAACDIESAAGERKPTAWSRHQLDPERNRVWILTGAGITVYDAANAGRVQRVALPEWHYAGRPYGCLPAIALGPKGEAVISSDVVPVLWRVDPDTLTATRHELQLDADSDKDIGFTMFTYSREQGAYAAVSGPHGTVWRIDRDLRNAQKMSRRMPQGLGCATRVSF